jgi:hypothetical protein
MHQAVETIYFSPIAFFLTVPRPKNISRIKQYKYQVLCAHSAAGLQEVMRLIRTSYADLQTEIIVVYQTLRSSHVTSNLQKL